MLLSSQSDFKYDDQSTGDGSSGSRGYLDAIREPLESVVGFIGNLTRRGSDDNQEPGRDDRRRNHNLDRETLQYIAQTTLETLDEGEYFPPGQDGPYDLSVKIQWTDENTRYYGPDAGKGGEILESEFIKINEEGGVKRKEEKEEEENKDGNTTTAEEAKIASSLNERQRENKLEKSAAASKARDDDNANSKVQTRNQAIVSPDPKKRATLINSQRTSIFIGEYSTLVGARKIHLALAGNPDRSNKKIGVLNFASAKKPGGGFFNGSQAQEESLARTSTLYPSLTTETAYQFYANYLEDPDNSYYTHAMVYSPGVVLMRDDYGEWRSPVEVDVLTSAAVNAGEIRRELEREERLRKERVAREERLRKERVDMENWKRKGEERKKEMEKAMAERRRLREKAAMDRKKKEEGAKLKKEQASSVKLQKEMVVKKETDKEKGKTKDSASEKEEPPANSVKLQKEMVVKKETDEEKGKAKISASEKEEPLVEQDKPETAAAVENENEKGEEVGEDKPEENQEHTIDSPESGLGSDSDSQLKDAEDITESEGTPIQDDQPKPEAPPVPPKVDQEPTSSSAIVHPLSPPTQPSQAPDPDPILTYTLALRRTEMQIYQTMYSRISRILHLFQLQQTPHLILGSFGTGVFKNHIDDIATIFAELLIKSDGRFKDVFQTVVFAILGKETVRVFTQIFRKYDRRAQKERSCKACVFEDWFENESDGDVREGDEERMMRMMRWEAKRKLRYSSMDAYAGSFDPAQIDAASHPLSLDANQASTSSGATGSAFYAPSFDAAASPKAAQAIVASCPPSFDAQASAIPHSTFSTDAAIQANPTYVGIPEDAMILTRGDEQVNLVTANAPNAMVTENDIEMTETKSLQFRSNETRNDDDDVEMLYDSDGS